MGNKRKFSKWIDEMDLDYNGKCAAQDAEDSGKNAAIEWSIRRDWDFQQDTEVFYRRLELLENLSYMLNIPLGALIWSQDYELYVGEVNNDDVGMEIRVRSNTIEVGTAKYLIKSIRESDEEQGCY